MSTYSLRARHLVASTLFVSLLLAASGCGGGPKLYPVSGKVLLPGDKALGGGQITFIPDESKGNKGKYSPTGPIGSDGSYTVKTDTSSGAPLGWYKVTVRTDAPGMGMGGSGTQVDPNPKNPAPLQTPGDKINPKYKDMVTTDLRVEVVASPSAEQYTIKLQ